ncbi:MAG: DUF4831 family protein [Paludibacteraceae bacterium]
MNNRILALMVGILPIASLNAQLIQENDLALVYYMPETQLVFDVEYTEETLEAGPFFLFAEKYLGTDDVIQEDQTLYTLTDIQAKTRTVPDLTRAYKVTPEKGISLQLLSLTDKGLLYGYNVGRYYAPKKPKETPETTTKPRVRRPDIMPLMEEQIAAATLKAKAEGAAKQIYRIRETRMYILSGEVDNAPADGKAMELVLKELDKQERKLTELFTGKRTIKRLHQTFTYIPTKSEEVALFYFSGEKGITTQEDASGTPVLLTIAAHKQVMTAGGSIGKKAPHPSQIYYNLPGSADYAINYEDRLLVERSLPIAQFGISVPLARDLFTDTPMKKIYFNTKTGNIQSISTLQQ